MNEPCHIYCISGLAADAAILQNLRLNGIVHYIHWPQPIKDESFEGYIVRIKEQIKHSKNVVLLGVSFGGMVAISLNKYLQVEKTFIISSIKNAAEKPGLLQIAWIKWLYPLFIPNVVKAFPAICNWSFGAQTPNEKQLLKSLIKRADNYLLNWSIKRIIAWENTVSANNIYHLHGTADRVFPIRNIKNCIEIKDGTHFAVYDKAEEISHIINNILETP